MQAEADAIERELAALGTPERARKERAYLKSDLVHLGVTVPKIRGVARAFQRAHPDLDHEALVALVSELWYEPRAAPVFERRFVAVELLEAHGMRLGPADVPLIERLLREARTWALVDNLAATVVGDLEQRHPDALDPVVRRWASDDDFWLRRSSLLVHLGPLRRGGGDFSRFGELADAMLAEREFFIRKAIGWVLRETGKRRPQLVAAWVEPRVARMAGLTFKEATKRLPDDVRQHLARVRVQALQSR